jgi:flagellin-like hook-associated protein FlgL
LEIEATGGANYVYKSDIFTDSALSKTVDDYNYEFKYGKFLSNASFSNLYGAVSREFDINLVMSGAATAARISVMGEHIGKLANGEDSNLTVTMAAGNAGYYVLEALEDGDFTAGTVYQEAFKITFYAGADGAKTETNFGHTVLAQGGGLTGSGMTFNLGSTTKFAKGDKVLVSYSAAAAINTDKFTVGQNGVTLAAVTGNNNYAFAEMDASGNVNVGRGNFTIDATATAGSYNMTVEPTAIAKSLYTLTESNINGTTVNRAASRVVGGSYPNGLKVDIGKLVDVESAVKTAAAYIEDLNVTTTVSGLGTATGSYIIEILRDGYILSGGRTAGQYLTASDFKVTFVDAATGVESVINPTFTAPGTLSFDGVTVTIGATAGNAPDARLNSGDTILIKNQLSITGTATAATVTADGLSILRTAAQGFDEFHLFNVQLDQGGNALRSRVDLSLQDNTSGTLTFSASNNSVATLETLMKDVSVFTNADGVNALANTQELTVFGNGKTATVYLEGYDTVEDFRAKLNAAILELGMGTGDANIDSQLVKYVTEEDAQKGGNYGVAGTLVFQGALVGDSSKINIIGDQGVINALSVMTLHGGENSNLEVTVRDAHNNRLIGKDTVSDNVLRGIIQGIDVKFSGSQLQATFNTANGKMNFTTSDNGAKLNLHVVDNRTEVQIGANQGQTFDVSIGQMNTTSLEIDDAFVVTMDESQKAITKFSQALEKVTSARATIGAQINRLEYTVKNLSISRENLISAESRIRDLDIAEESATFAKNQILVNAATAMLAQANTLPQIALQLLQ